LNIDHDWYNAIIAKRLAIRHSNAGTPRDARNVLRKATTTAIAMKRSLSAFYVEAHMNRIARTIRSSTLYNMNKTLQII
jgi:hypothetical protein